MYMYMCDQPHLFAEEWSGLTTGNRILCGREVALSGGRDRNRTSNEINT